MRRLQAANYTFAGGAPQAMENRSAGVGFVMDVAPQARQLRQERSVCREGVFFCGRNSGGVTCRGVPPEGQDAPSGAEGKKKGPCYKQDAPPEFKQVNSEGPL